MKQTLNLVQVGEIPTPLFLDNMDGDWEICMRKQLSDMKEYTDKYGYHILLSPENVKLIKSKGCHNCIWKITTNDKILLDGFVDLKDAIFEPIGIEKR